MCSEAEAAAAPCAGRAAVVSAVCGCYDTRMREILLIDDDITSLDIISFLFEGRGFGLRRCANGHAAIDAVREKRPDLILVDLMMPGLNGMDTVREIRALGLESLPIIAFTAAEDVDLHMDALASG